jgi:DNA-binding FadR family transcriptional regulator
LRAVFRASFARTLPVARATIGQHGAVAAAIREGDGVGAEAAMLALIELTAASLGKDDALVAADAAAADG